MTASRSAVFRRTSRWKNIPTKESRKELVRFLQDNRLGVSGYAADFTGVNPVAAGNKQKYLDLFRRNVEMCVDIGSPAIRVDSIAAPGSIEDKDYQAAFDRLAGRLARRRRHRAKGGHPPGVGVRAGLRFQQAVGGVWRCTSRWRIRTSI